MITSPPSFFEGPPAPELDRWIVHVPGIDADHHCYATSAADAIASATHFYGLTETPPGATATRLDHEAT